MRVILLLALAYHARTEVNVESLALPAREAAQVRTAIDRTDWSTAESLLFDAVGERPDSAERLVALGFAHFENERG